LRFAVFEHLKVVGREPFDEVTVAPRIHIDVDEVDPAPEYRRLLILRKGGGKSRQENDNQATDTTELAEH
jgi:hypothetical protein